MPHITLVLPTLTRADPSAVVIDPEIKDKYVYLIIKKLLFKIKT